MNGRNSQSFLFASHTSPGQASISVTAGLAAAILLITAAWQLGDTARVQNSENIVKYDRPSTEEILTRPRIQDSRDWKNELSAIGVIGTSTENAAEPEGVGDIIARDFIQGFAYLKDSGRYSPERAAELGRAIGSNARIASQFVVHGESELTKDTNVSKDRVLAYRSDMREALSVLITDTEPEFELFAFYIETKNPERLRELEEAADRYKQAEKALLTVVVPQDAAALHLRTVNSLGSYADSLLQLIRYADDELATLTVLRTYNDAEREMLYAFDALASYYVRKSAEN